MEISFSSKFAAITAALAHWQSPVAGAGAGSTVTALLAYLLASHTAPQSADITIAHVYCPGTPQPRFSDDWHSFTTALASLPLDYLLCALIGILGTFILDAFHLVKQALSAHRQQVHPGSRQPRRPEFLALDVTRGH